ncbi:dickkopf-related protein 3 isoform X1 [Oryzias latipes]|uniref:dickkopf-related protein 3 isoform X1 n=1 Tax=Oryzias latipes TaxID=8090 RepID=UPI0009D94CB5|nr:dickkopf-related protein 3 isoform X1 [Oryzias latipes]
MISSIKMISSYSAPPFQPVSTPPQTFQIKAAQLRAPCVTRLLPALVVEVGKMSDATLLSVLCVLWAAGGGSLILQDSLERGPVSLNEMFQELGELMEDTQHILGEAVDQIIAEGEKFSSGSRDPLHNRTLKITKSGDRVAGALDRTEQGTDNRTGEALVTHVHEALSWNGVNHECMVDEDCGDLKYCLYEIQSSRCLPCTASDMPCRKDEECCSTQMCVWGQCTANVSRGTEGTICQGQNDCRPELCCAFQRELLFPVCNPKPQRGESCLNHPNLLMDMLAWDQEGPRDHCQCADHLQCRAHGDEKLCLCAAVWDLCAGSRSQAMLHLQLIHLKKTCCTHSLIHARECVLKNLNML